MEGRLSRQATYSVNGFTLIEVTLALMVLGGSLVVLLGLQSSIIERTLRDSKKQQAMLLARQLLSEIEMMESPLPAQKTDGPFRDVLNSLTLRNPAAGQPEPGEADFVVHLEVENVGIPDVAQDAMRKITLTLSWGPNSVDQLSAVYFTQGD